MKRALNIILLMMLSQVSLGQQSKAFDRVVSCINDELRQANLGLENLTDEKSRLVHNVDSLVEYYSYSTISTYNNLNVKVSVKYYYHSSVESAKALEAKLMQLHNLEISKISTEKIIRLGKLIVVIDHDKKFDGIYDYNRTISLLLYDSYVNSCEGCKTDRN